jgi:Thioredoxin-like
MTKNKLAFLHSRFLLLALLIMGPMSFVFAIEIKGTSKEFAGKTLTLQAELDEITERRITIGETSISEEGKFNLQADASALTENHHVFILRCGNYEGNFYAKKNGKYEIIFSPLDQNLPKTFDKSIIPVIWKSGSDSLHVLSLEWYRQYDSFLDAHYYDFAVEKFQGQPSQRTRIDKEKNDMAPKGLVSRDSAHHEKFKEHVLHFSDTVMKKHQKTFEQEPFLQLLKSCSMARLNLLAGDPKIKTIQGVLSQYPREIEHPAVAQLMHLTFDHIADNDELKIKKKNDQLIQNIEFDSLIAELSKGALIQDRDLKELAILFLIKNQFYSKKINNAIYYQWLDVLSKQCQPTTKQIALYTLSNRNKCLKNWSCPEIQLVDTKYKSVKNKQFEGKLTYLIFFATWNTRSMKEVQAMEGLANHFKENVQFVAICLDDEMSGFLDYTHTHRKLKTQIFYAGNHPEIKEQFCISALPHAILLDPNGFYLNDYTKLPSEGIGGQIERWLQTNGSIKNNGTWKE